MTPIRSSIVVSYHQWPTSIDIWAVDRERSLGSLSTYRGLDIGETNDHGGETSGHEGDPDVGGV